MTSREHPTQDSCTSIEEAANYLQLPSETIDFSPSFPFLLPRHMLEKMEKGNIDDPLCRQFIPQKSNTRSSFSKDPLEEGCYLKQNCPRLLQKYKKRALLLCNDSCAIHCRFCFRQHSHKKAPPSYEHELSIIEKDPSIEEAILSGGDPLLLSDAKLLHLLQAIDAIPHIRRIRIHTRLPVALPKRITPQLIAQLLTIQKPIFMVLHTNHINEFDETTWHHLSMLQNAGIPLLTQSVLLKGVNDTTEPLTDLFTALIDHKILPYYIHALDHVLGAEQFYVDDTTGVELITNLRNSLSGFAVPRFVREESGKKAKTILK